MQDWIIGRIMAFAIVLLAVVALTMRVQLTMAEDGLETGAAIWSMMRFFTVLTTAMVAFVLFMHLVIAPPRPSQLAGATLATCIVGVVYHLLLADLQDLSGTALLVDHAFHTAVPILTLLWWLLFAPKQGMGAFAPLTWLIWPILYAVYAIGRGLQDGVYPYPFLDLATLGQEMLAQNVGMFLGAFAIAGYVLWGIGKLVSRQSARPA